MEFNLSLLEHVGPLSGIMSCSTANIPSIESSFAGAGAQKRANIVGIAPRVSGLIINIPVHDNQEVKTGDLLFEIDPADYKTAFASAKASVANLEANLA
jgi:multidrug resistance efflux pump